MKYFIAICLLLAVTSAASAATIGFTQEGWSAGGSLRVDFTGSDADLDGAIALGELEAFTATWKAPDQQTVVWALADVQPDGFFYIEISNYVIFAANSKLFACKRGIRGRSRFLGVRSVPLSCG